MTEPTQKTIIFWGTYDLGKPRVRLLLQGLRLQGANVIECHADIWRRIEDKSRIRPLGWIIRAFRWIAAYPPLVIRYMLLPRHEIIVIGYLGHLDVILIALFARLRGAKIVWDAFLSLYDTVVNDRRMVPPWSPVAWILYTGEWFACRAAHTVFLDTQAHADFFETTFRLRKNSVGVVPVGAEDIFAAHENTLSNTPRGAPWQVLFYGQCIPLHGIDTIVRAARILQDRAPGRFAITIIGTGQEENLIDSLITSISVTNVKRIKWVDYRELPQAIASADLCLGIFGTSGKAQRVIPNKVYQIIAAGKPLITADSPAIRERYCPGSLLALVPPGDPGALAKAVIEMRNRPFSPLDDRQKVLADDVGKALIKVFDAV